MVATNRIRDRAEKLRKQREQPAVTNGAEAAIPVSQVLTYKAESAPGVTQLSEDSASIISLLQKILKMQPVINITIPPQAAPIVNVTSGPVHVAAPVVHVAAAVVPPAQVTVTPGVPAQVTVEASVIPAPQVTVEGSKVEFVMPEQEQIVDIERDSEGRTKRMRTKRINK